MTPEKMKELLQRAKAGLAAREAAAVTAMQEMVEHHSPQEISFQGTGVSDEQLQQRNPEAEEAAVEVIRAISENLQSSARKYGSDETGHRTDEDNRSSSSGLHQDRSGVARTVVLNARQQQFLDAVVSGQDTVLVGSAGTGKTTSMRQTTRALIDSGRLPVLSVPTKYLRTGAPGAVILSYTRKAVNNIRHAVVQELKQNTITIHKLLEFAPVFYEAEDPQTGLTKKTMRFEPSRNRSNPLPQELCFLAYEESSMVGVDLYALLQDALPHPHQEVFLGDIQQLPPIFGPAILGFKMLELPVIELTEIYRQAMNSPIISLAWNILRGDAASSFHPSVKRIKMLHPHLQREVERITVPALQQHEASNEDGTVVIQPWQKSLSADNALITAIKQFTTWSDTGYYNPNEDIILCPFNKALGTVELNKGIAQHLGRKRGAKVYEVIAGFNKHYLAVGDRVLLDKEDAVIVDINRNGEYLGATPQAASIHLDRWGHLQEERTEEERILEDAERENFDLDAIENFMAAVAGEDTERVQSASHVVVCRYALTDEEVSLNKAAEINALLGGYAVTVHKFQGSEAEKVFFLLHSSHATMVSRELLYTGVTRARKFLHIICEKDTFYKGVRSQRIEGNSIAEKAESFKGKAEKSLGDGRSTLESSRKTGGEFDPMHWIKMNATGRNEKRETQEQESSYGMERDGEVCAEEESICEPTESSIRTGSSDSDSTNSHMDDGGSAAAAVPDMVAAGAVQKTAREIALEKLAAIRTAKQK